jgi:predicted nucleic acid-binding protein
LIYAALGKSDYPAKWERAHTILGEGNNGLSAQVLAEFYHNVSRPGRLDAAAAASWMERLALLPIVSVDKSLVFQGIASARRFQISYWDGAVVAAAQRLGTATLYSEDLNHGQAYGSVRVINPFLPV